MHMSVICCLGVDFTFQEVLTQFANSSLFLMNGHCPISILHVRAHTHRGFP